MKEDIEKIVNEIALWIKKEIQTSGFENALIAVSGGIDSAVVLALTVRALGKDNVYALCMPYGKASIHDTNDAKKIITKLGIAKEHIYQHDIYKPVQRIFTSIPDLKESSLKSENIRKGNVMARVRMVFLYDLAKSLQALVIGTENKSEYFLGYFTRFGDEASDIEPIRGLYKTQVIEVAKYLGTPDDIIAKPPSAGLWSGQRDEGEFGFTYFEADQVLEKYIDEELPMEGIVDLGISRQTVEKVIKRVKDNEFKHHTPKVFGNE